MKAKVSVIVPSFNHQQFVAETIQSVVNQDYDNIELIVIDDGSTDQTPVILKSLEAKHGFKLIIKNNEGLCSTLNRAIQLASGDYITFIASDDFMPVSRISEQVKFLELNPLVDVVAGSIMVIDESSKELSLKEAKTLGEVTFEKMIIRNQIFAPTAMMRKTIYDRFGLYDTSYAFEDYPMWLNIIKSGGKIVNTSNLWAYYRINRSNLEKRFNWYYQGYVQTLSKYLPDPRAEKALNHYQLIYSAKMTFLKGRTFVRENDQILKKLGLFHRISIHLVSLIPGFFRHKILYYLLREL